MNKSYSHGQQEHLVIVDHHSKTSPLVAQTQVGGGVSSGRTRTSTHTHTHQHTHTHTHTQIHITFTSKVSLGSVWLDKVRYLVDTVVQCDLQRVNNNNGKIKQLGLGLQIHAIQLIKQ